jgi:hypothetical protein
MRIATFLCTGLLLALGTPRPAPPQSWWSLADSASIEEAFVLGRALLERFELDPEAGRFAETAEKSLARLDPGRLYARMGSAPGERSVALAGALESGAYLVRLHRDGRPRLDPRFGSFVAELRLQPDELAGIRGEGFEAALFAEAHLGGLSSERVLRAASSTLGLLEAALAQRPPPAEPSRAACLHPRLGPEDVSILADLRRDLPRSLELFEELIELEDLAVPAPDGLRLRYRGRLRLDALERRWPRLGRALGRLGELLELSATLRTPSGRPLLAASVATASASFTLELRAASGVLLPLQPGPDERLDPLGQGRHPLSLEAELHLRDRGLHTHIGPLSVPLLWSAGRDSSHLAAWLERPPPVSIEGSALYVIPTSVIDALIPGSLQALARDFAAVLATSSAGPGWRMDALHRGAWIEARARGKLLDNGIIQLGSGMTNRRLRLGKAAREELRGLGAELLAALESDWRGAHPRGAR